MGRPCYICGDVFDDWDTPDKYKMDESCPNCRNKGLISELVEIENLLKLRSGWKNEKTSC